jgi:hypothetical protein
MQFLDSQVSERPNLKNRAPLLPLSKSRSFVAARAYDQVHQFECWEVRLR